VSTQTETWAGRLGLAVGLLLALAAVWSWQIGGGPGALGTDARFTAVPPGELTVEPAEFLSARSLAPGEEARGDLRVRNIAGAPLTVRLRARPSSRELDRGLWVEVRAVGARGAEPLFAGPLGRLRRATRPFAIPAGAVRELGWEARAAPGGSGGTADVAVELRTEVRGG
jgi:hypothetical protein